MAITTLDGAIAGMQPPNIIMKVATPALVVGRPHMLAYLAGMPGASVLGTPGVNGVAVTAPFSGQIPFTNPGAGNSYLARLQIMSNVPGVVLLVDKLWYNTGLVVTQTTIQSFASVAWPARDRVGAVSGADVMIGLEITAATGAGAATPAIVYTNNAGTGSRNGTMMVPYVASSALGAFYPFALNAGDVGVQSIQSITLSVSMTSGSISLVAYRVLAALEIAVANAPNAIDALTSGFPRLYYNTAPFLLFIPSAVTATNIQGHMIVTQG